MVNGQLSGVGYYTQGLIESLSRAYPEELELIGHYFNFLGKKTNLDVLPKGSNISYIESRLLPGKIINVCRRLGFQPPIELFVHKKFDIALYPNFVSLPSLLRKPSAVVIHDLCYNDLPNYVHKKNRDFLQRFVPKAIKQSTLIVCISEFTKKRIEDTYDVKDKNFLITHIPPASKLSVKKDGLNSLGIKNKYLLYVGTLEPRKNIHGLAEAYIRLPQEVRSKYALVLAGGKGWYIEDDLKYISKLQQKGFDIILTGYVSDDQRADLYANASLFILASFYEGFGIPVLEAMSYDCPCALSDIEVLHEVSGSAAVYFNPADPDDIALNIGNILKDTRMTTELRGLGRERLKRYNWPSVAKKVHEQLMGVLNE